MNHGMVIQIEWQSCCRNNMRPQPGRAAHPVVSQIRSVSGDQLQPTIEPQIGTVYRKKTVLSTIQALPVEEKLANVFVKGIFKRYHYQLQKNHSTEFELFSIACSTGQYFPVFTKLNWVNTGILKIQAHLTEQYRKLTVTILAKQGGHYWM